MSLLELFLGKNKSNSIASVAQLKSFKIFLVDDNVAFSRLIENYILTKIAPNLPLFTIEIIKYENGKDCIANLASNPDIILLDFYLSDSANENGDVIFLEIKKNFPSTKVVLLTGLEETVIVKNLLSLGLFGFVIKDEDMFDKIKILIKEAAKHTN